MGFEDIKLSFVIPVYNKKDYIENCVNSILKISEFSYEIILVDDGSKDNSYEVCKNLSSCYSNVIAISQSNQGVSAARNTGIEIAKGQYISFVDADDFVKDSFGSELADALKTESDYYKFNYTRWISDDKQGVGRITIDAGYHENMELWIPQIAGLEVCAMCVWSSIYKRAIINDNTIRFKIGMKTCEDFLFNMDYIKHIRNYYISDGAGYCYRDNPFSVTNNRPLSHAEDYSVIYDAITKYLLSLGAESEMWNLLYRKLTRWCIDLVYSWKSGGIKSDIAWKNLDNRDYYQDLSNFTPHSFQEKLEKILLAKRYDGLIMLYKQGLLILRKLLGKNNI